MPGCSKGLSAESVNGCRRGWSIFMFSSNSVAVSICPHHLSPCCLLWRWRPTVKALGFLNNSWRSIFLLSQPLLTAEGAFSPRLTSPTTCSLMAWVKMEGDELLWWTLLEVFMWYSSRFQTLFHRLIMSPLYSHSDAVCAPCYHCHHVFIKKKDMTWYCITAKATWS